MRFEIIYFDDQISNIECYQTMLMDDFLITGYTDCTVFEMALEKQKPHGIMLDLHMPVWDGLTLYNKIVSSKNYNGCPIFFISSDISDESRLKTIQTGAIDFFDRSISEEELKLRLQNKIKVFFQGKIQIDLGNMRFDDHAFSIHVKGKPIDLTLFEMRILSSIIRKLPASVNKNELMEQIWGSNAAPGKMNVHVSNINLKLIGWNHEINIKENSISFNPF